MSLLLNPRNIRDFAAVAPYIEGGRSKWGFLCGGPKPTISLKIRGVETPIVIRAQNRADRSVARYVFADQFHLPVSTMPERPIILDLGANIGLTAVHYAALYPEARIVAVEMDAENAALARRNTAHLPGVTVVNAAIWDEAGTVAYDAGASSDAFSASSDALGAARAVNAITLNQLVEDYDLGRIDLLKMDIEHAEERVLARDIEWMGRVRQVNIEVHRASYLQDCVELLARAGFRAVKDSRHWSAVVGVRE